jgi:hypothetical protein
MADAGGAVFCLYQILNLPKPGIGGPCHYSAQQQKIARLRATQDTTIMSRRINFMLWSVEALPHTLPGSCVCQAPATSATLSLLLTNTTQTVGPVANSVGMGKLCGLQGMCMTKLMRGSVLSTPVCCLSYEFAW